MTLACHQRGGRHRCPVTKVPYRKPMAIPDAQNLQTTGSPATTYVAGRGDLVEFGFGRDRLVTVSQTPLRLGNDRCPRCPAGGDLGKGPSGDAINARIYKNGPVLDVNHSHGRPRGIQSDSLQCDHVALVCGGSSRSCGVERKMRLAFSQKSGWGVSHDVEVSY